MVRRPKTVPGSQPIRGPRVPELRKTMAGQSAAIFAGMQAVSSELAVLIDGDC